jgi:hypothetical protein
MVAPDVLHECAELFGGPDLRPRPEGAGRLSILGVVPRQLTPLDRVTHRAVEHSMDVLHGLGGEATLRLDPSAIE